MGNLAKFPGNIHWVDKGGFNAMQVAAKYRRPGALKWTIENGVGRAGVDKEERKEGLTALMMACMRFSTVSGTDFDDPLCATTLIRAGANPLKQDLNGLSCMHHALKCGLPRIAKFLASISEGPDLVHLKDLSGESPMILLDRDWRSNTSTAFQEACAEMDKVWSAYDTVAYDTVAYDTVAYDTVAGFYVCFSSRRRLRRKRRRFRRLRCGIQAVSDVP